MGKCPRSFRAPLGSYHYSTSGNITSMDLTSMSYNQNGELVSSASPQGTTNYTYDQNGNRTSQIGPVGTISYGFNSNNQMTSYMSSSTSATYSYNPYGIVSSTTGSWTMPFGFAGGYRDITGLSYLIDRYYDPATGQFVSLDPLVEQTNTPYGYAWYNATNETDPTGLGAIKCNLEVCLAVSVPRIGGNYGTTINSALASKRSEAITMAKASIFGFENTRQICFVPATVATVELDLIPMFHRVIRKEIYVGNFDLRIKIPYGTQVTAIVQNVPGSPTIEIDEDWLSTIWRLL